MESEKFQFGDVLQLTEAACRGRNWGKSGDGLVMFIARQTKNWFVGVVLREMGSKPGDIVEHFYAPFFEDAPR